MKQIDHPLGCRREVRQIRPARRSRSRRPSRSLEQRDPAGADRPGRPSRGHAGPAQKMPPGQVHRAFEARIHIYSFTTVWLRLRIRLVTLVYAANSLTFRVRVAGHSPWLTYFSAAVGILREVFALLAEGIQEDGASPPESAAGPWPRGTRRRCAPGGVVPPSFMMRSANTRAASTIRDIIHQIERLQRRIGDVDAHLVRLAARGVEVRHARWRNGALPVGIQAAAVQVVSMVLHVGMIVVPRSPAQQTSTQSPAGW